MKRIPSTEMLNAFDRLGEDVFISNRQYRELGGFSNLHIMLTKFDRYKVCHLNVTLAFVQWVNDTLLNVGTYTSASEHCFEARKIASRRRRLRMGSAIIPSRKTD